MPCDRVVDRTGQLNERLELLLSPIGRVDVGEVETISLAAHRRPIHRREVVSSALLHLVGEEVGVVVDEVLESVDLRDRRDPRRMLDPHRMHICLPVGVPLVAALGKLPVLVACSTSRGPPGSAPTSLRSPGLAGGAAWRSRRSRAWPSRDRSTRRCHPSTHDHRQFGAPGRRGDR